MGAKTSADKERSNESVPCNAGGQPGPADAEASALSSMSRGAIGAEAPIEDSEAPGNLDSRTGSGAAPGGKCGDPTEWSWPSWGPQLEDDSYMVRKAHCTAVSFQL